MPYRRTETVIRRLAARHAAILDAAQALAAESGMGAVQIAPVADRAGIAAGTVYRYFPGKTDMVSALIAALCESRDWRCPRRGRGRSRAPVGASGGDCNLRRPRAGATAARLGDACRARRCRDRPGAARLPQGARSRVRGAVAPRDRAGPSSRARTPARPPRRLVGALLEGLIGPLAPDRSGDRGARATRCRRLRCSRCGRSASSMRARAASSCRRRCRPPVVPAN